MDRDGLLMHGEAFFANVPTRSFNPMPLQPLVPWTPSRLVAASVNWLMAESFSTLPEPVTAKKRRV